ncbi:MAG: hypothetical protein L0H38_03620, partial [bacterium]|nr:hypothetical protein [bacterium]
MEQSPSADELPRGVEAPFTNPNGPRDGRFDQEHNVLADPLGQEHDIQPQSPEVNEYQENLKKMLAAAAIE